MRAVVLVEPGRVAVRSVPDPVLEHPEDALVTVRRAAVCGTDLHIVAHSGSQVPAGTVLGHEYVGTVLATGSAVRAVRPGDRVAGADYTACGRCWWCRRGDHWQCPHRRFFGTGGAFGPPLPGSQAEIVRVPHADVVLQAVPDGVSDEAAVLLGDVLATGYAAVRRSGLRPGDCLAVLGGGPVGQLTSLAAQALAAGPVLVVEPVSARRALAADNGALAVPPDDARGLVDALTDGRGADAVIDAIGGRTGLDAALRLVRRGGTVVSVGVHTDDTWPLPVARAFADELTLRFVIGDAIRDRDPLTALVQAGVVDPTIVLAPAVPLAEAADGYARMADRRTLKALIEM